MSHTACKAFFHNSVRTPQAGVDQATHVAGQATGNVEKAAHTAKDGAQVRVFVARHNNATARSNRSLAASCMQK